jgi:hypothetical protein
VKQVFRSLCGIAALIVISSALPPAQAQIVSATPDPVTVQLTSSPIGFYSFASDISANGRFVVFESIGNLDTQNPRNADGNREIFLMDYAQRRIFQLTDTRNVQKPPASPTPTPTPTPTPSPAASPTPTPGPTPPDLSLVKIEISNNRPMISLEPALDAGKRTYTIVFTSNAPDPKSFDGTDSAALTANANLEIWVYQLQAIDDTFVLSTGNDIPFTDLAAGTFRQVTNTTPSRALHATTVIPDVIDDNREPAISDDGNTVAFISTRNLVTAVGNADANPELFFCRTTGGFAAGTNTFAQGTNTQDTIAGISDTLQQNPSLSANGSVVAFYSRANFAGAANDDKNPEIYAADFTGSGITNIRQITKTKPEAAGSTNAGLTLNVLSPGRRLSRDGKFVAYESRAESPASNNGTNTSFFAIFVSDVPTLSTTASTANQVGLRATAEPGDVTHFPTFSDYDPSLAPHSLVFSSALNFNPNGTFPAAADDATTGLNPVALGSIRPTQVFATQVPVTSSNTFVRLTKNPVQLFAFGIRPLASSTIRRIAFSLQGIELGGGNGDGSSEIFYLLTPVVTTEAGAALAFYTGASNWGPFASASPTASPTPTPSPSPGDPAGLAPGELGIVRSTVALATSDKTAVGGPEATRRPVLPVELNGVTVSINGSAAGLYFVGDSPAEGISFVTPIGLPGGVFSVVINNGGTTYRGFVQIVPAQPDVFTSTNDAGGIAMVCNVTNTAVSGCVTGPFRATTADSTGTQVPTQLEIYLTGVRFALPAETKVTFVNGTTTTDVAATAVRPNLNNFGTDLLNITLPATLAGAAPIDYKIIVTVTRGSLVFTSRPAATASQVTIIP